MLECMKKDKEKKNQYKLGNFDTTIRYQELILIHIDTTSIKESKSINKEFGALSKWILIMGDTPFRY